jgi:hypothetical protein
MTADRFMATHTTGMRAACLVAAMTLCTSGAAAPAAAPPCSELWIAASKTAMAVTGDVRFTPSSMTFAPGPRIAIRYLKDVSGKVSYVNSVSGTARAQLYRVLSPDLVLRGGNRLCGRRPTFLSVLRTHGVGGGLIFLTVYTGATEPHGTASDAICAGYTYSAR